MASQDLHLTPARVGVSLKDGTLRLSVVGLGRIGLPTAAIFARAGARVIGLDIDPRVVESIRAGKCHFADEPGLDEAVAATVMNGRLTATLDFEEAVGRADFVIISVPHPGEREQDARLLSRTQRVPRDRSFPAEGGGGHSREYSRPGDCRELGPTRARGGIRPQGWCRLRCGQLPGTLRPR